ncbi:hypothetical protein BofuT4_P033880.1 [Botrytis cinerea T4]|uniref:Uncharacterized protein n=1 Tax=Botryotinia fuckeliana (strain T4) TaxID=999810 RepID=G2Y818_BOTF4|nr:hypothetical protein BofuT4_P033880.1 [Botrytis cinerea T4]
MAMGSGTSLGLGRSFDHGIFYWPIGDDGEHGDSREDVDCGGGVERGLGRADLS